MNEDERLAKVAIEEVIPGARMEFREEQHGDGGLRHDFWLHRPERDRDAVEVTSVRDEDRMRTAAKLAEHGPVLETEYCARSWFVWLDPRAHLEQVAANIDRRLAELEGRGIERMTRRRPRFAPPEVERLRSDLGVQSAGSFSPENTPTRIYLHLGGTASMVGEGKVSGAVAREATANADKLRETGAPQRHLFVHLPYSDPAAYALVDDDVEPGESEPDLPPEVTHAWAAAKRFGTDDEFTVWRARSGEPWRSAGVVTVPGGGPAPLP